MTNNSTNPTEPSRETQSLADKPGVTEADRELAERLCFGMSEKAIGEAALLIARHREQETARSADVGRPQVFADAELVAETVAQRCSVGSKRDGSPKAPQRYATIWQAARLGVIEYAKLTQGDRALSTPPADDGGLRAALEKAKALLECIEQRSHDNCWWVNATDPETAVCDTLGAVEAALGKGTQ